MKRRNYIHLAQKAILKHVQVVFFKLALTPGAESNGWGKTKAYSENMQGK